VLLQPQRPVVFVVVYLNEDKQQQSLQVEQVQLHPLIVVLLQLQKPVVFVVVYLNVKRNHLLLYVCTYL